MREFLQRLDRRARTRLAAGAAIVLLLVFGSAAWLLRTDWQVLFADLHPQDTAAMVAELDRQKVPYRIGADGNTILVAAEAVHATRLKLMGRDMPLHGTAGFELFNNADFGMTEFAQKINYQRALQGEITRTILSLAEVRDARVHLTLPEEGLFRRANGKGKAAVTLTLKPGSALAPSQVLGIQRLVAAAVPGLTVGEVTIVDQRGVALTRAAGDGEQDVGSARLDLKRETESLLARKASEVLERTLGAGQAIASVDATLNMDQVRTTSEEVLGAPGRGGQQSGVLVRERETVRSGAAPLDARADPTPQTQRESEFQAGRRVEQVVSHPGSIRRLQVVAVVTRALDAPQLEQLRTLVAAAVGAVPERGDTVVVQTLAAFASPVAQEAPRTTPVPNVSAARTEPTLSWERVAAFAGLLIALGLSGYAALRGREQPPAALAPPDRERALQQLQQWLEAPASTSANTRAQG
jgi:flagellar M-ring protein FliF